jgi:putative SOS response-associated peptidase YedK
LVRLGRSRPLFAFAGLWASWRGLRGPKSPQVEGEHQLFGFLTTEANAIVAPIHPKAMPVILTTPDEFERWLEVDTVDAMTLQRPLPDCALKIVAKGEKEDPPSKVAYSGEGASRRCFSSRSSLRLFRK